jgi:hypothetical protein
MLKLENVTLVAMSSVDMDNTIKAILDSCTGIQYGAVKLISHVKPANLPASIDFCLIDKISSIDEYSYHMIYSLDKYIDTEFALTIQADGYVVNPASWRNEFLQYDYIGAPFALPRDHFSYRDINNKIFRVGNGGFSLRSKKLIALPNKLQLPWKAFHGHYNEDGFICAMNRHIYEANDCRFAPIDVAKYFSHEAPMPEIEGITPFGFHGKKSKYLKKKPFSFANWLKKLSKK